jgi:hypothetical protein
MIKIVKINCGKFADAIFQSVPDRVNCGIFPTMSSYWDLVQFGDLALDWRCGYAG